MVKKILLCFCLGGLVLGVHTPLHAAPTKVNVYVDQIAQMQPGSTEEEVLKDAEQVAKMQDRSVEDVLTQIHRELAADVKKGEKEMASILGDSEGNRFLVPSKKGNIYYTASYTGGINHGHVGIYYTEKIIVESTPERKGVKSIGYRDRKVWAGAVIQSVTTTDKKKHAAADWAYSRAGKDGYSHNFATNRMTSHYGDKNCSKLLWSSFILKAGIDVDKDKGAGVYPRDMRDSSLTITIKTIE
jgi:uncharacterized protein YycO